MKVVEIIKLGREMLKTLSENDVIIGDWKYIEMYDEYCRMRNNGIKYRAAIAEVALCHNISRAKAERIIRRFSKEC